MGYTMDYKSLGNKKVLVVEDVELNQYLARHIMESWGFEVEIAVNGAEALEMLEHKMFDLILMDIQMPVMDGMEATRRIRKHSDPIKASIPIVALTANTFKEEVESYFAVGMNDCLPKPFDEPRLFKIVSKCLTKNSVAPEARDQKPEQVPAAEKKCYDLAIVTAISGGDNEFVLRMVQLFLDTMPASLAELQKSCTEQDWAQVGKLAHKLKSTVDSMGVESLKKHIRTLEMNGKNQQCIEDIPFLVQKVKDELELAMSAVRKDFNL